jgi:hypothetical protein
MRRYKRVLEDVDTLVKKKSHDLLLSYQAITFNTVCVSEVRWKLRICVFVW